MISFALQEGSRVLVYNEERIIIFTLMGILQGYTSSTVAVRYGNTIHVYGEDGIIKYSSMPIEEVSNVKKTDSRGAGTVKKHSRWKTFGFVIFALVSFCCYLSDKGKNSIGNSISEPTEDHSIIEVGFDPLVNPNATSRSEEEKPNEESLDEVILDDEIIRPLDHFEEFSSNEIPSEDIQENEKQEETEVIQID